MTVMEPTEIGGLEQDFLSTGNSYCSFNADTPEGKVKLYTAMNNPDFRLEEKLNTTIALKDLYAEQVEFVDEKSGEITESVRLVLIDADGLSYGCCSVGIFSALKKLMRVFGAPTWEEPIMVQPYQTPTRNGKRKIFTLRVINN